MGRRRVALVAAVVVALLAAGCSGSGGAAGDRDGGGRLRVVATTTQVADLAANVGGDRVQVTSLLKPGIDPHDYEPSPADIDAIAHADLVLENGVGLEAWLGDTIDGSGFDGPVVDTSQGVRLRMVEGAPDPHIWQDPHNAERMAANIEQGLAAAEPSAAGGSGGGPAEAGEEAAQARSARRHWVATAIAAAGIVVTEMRTPMSAPDFAVVSDSIPATPANSATMTVKVFGWEMK